MKRLLFPFTPLYDTLILKQRWWHRLAVVVFFLSFLVATGITAVITWSELSVSLSKDDRHAVIVNSYHELESPVDSSTGVDFDFVQPVPKTETTNKAEQTLQDMVDRRALKRDMETKAIKVEVPKVGVIAFPASMEESKSLSVCKTLSDRVAAAERKARAETIACALAVLVALFYALQVVYRLLLYVAFGRG